MERLMYIKIKKGEGRLLKSGGSWIFDNEISETSDDTADGELVKVLDFDDYFMGWGFYNSASKIRVRMLSRYRKEKPDLEFFRERVRAAVDYRRNVVDMNACRLIFSEADFFPGMVVDKYNDLLVVESLSLGIDRLKPVILRLLLEELKEDGFTIRGIYERSDAPVRKKEGMKPFKGWLYTKKDGFIEKPFNDMQREWNPDKNFPDRPENPVTEIVENGVKYKVDVENGQKTGFFLDQKFNRLAIQNLSRGKSVLDCFTHMGTFALNAARGGAKDVLGLDISELAVQEAADNAKLNGLDSAAHFEVADVLDALPEFRREGRLYDLVILDPPAFTKSKNTVKQAEKGYREINREGMMLVRDGGFLATCSCSHFMTEDLFKKVIGQAATAAHKRLRQVSFSTQAPDHPILWGLDTSYYLKFIIFQVVSEK
ncbi:MAG: class I SAM-dependent rRNA methyltransferase [bacterium LCO1.1]|uniref:Class I SAM-dependent rRNA methyltransferase n=1 Tax=Candidatus Weimeria bifida TaxID=2599074 RepID=A0A6N7IZT5_9FIRM|nr:class I SAM-dependent rRNA methyltransferase [Candidatus Weimeria bifida]